MSEANPRQLRVLHIVSSGGVPRSLQQTLFMPLLTRTPKQRVKAQVACLAPGVVPAAVLRQSGVPVHEIALSRRRFSVRGYKDLVRAAKLFRPDVIQAWGQTAQIASIAVRKRCETQPKVVWSVAGTEPLVRNAGLIDRRKLKWAAKLAASADRIVYASESGASHHRRAGFPDGGHLSIPPGVDAARFKPDPAARRKLREQLQIESDAFVIGMLAPFQPEYDHATLLKALGELIKTMPSIAVVLAGHGVQKGNGALMALIGGGALGTRTQLLGELSDVASLFNACDLVCSSALNDESRMTLVMAMLCGVPCVATGMGAQGEVIGQFGVAIEPGSPAAFARGITRVTELVPEKRAAMSHGARKHALKNYAYVSSLQKYLQLYGDLIGRQALPTQGAPTPEIGASAAAAAAATEASEPAPGKEPITVAEIVDPDSIETKVPEHNEPLPKWRLEQEAERAKREPEPSKDVGACDAAADVLVMFEAELAKPGSQALSPMSERARGIAEEMEELLPPEALAVPAPTVASRSTNAEPAPVDATSVDEASAAAPVVPASAVPEVTDEPTPEPLAIPAPTVASRSTTAEPALVEATSVDETSVAAPAALASAVPTVTDEPMQLALIEPSDAAQSDDPTVQLELLPLEARKRAVGESG